MEVRALTHAGAGTLLEVLRAPRAPKLLVVPNAGLMGDHQRELAMQWARDGLLSVGDTEYVAT